MAAVMVAGKVLRTVMMEPRGKLALEMAARQILRIVDVDGQQVGDLVCFNRHDPTEKLSPNNTALINGTIYISTGHALFSDRCSKMMTIVADTCGRHDLLCGSCSEGSNRFRYGVAGTPNCRDNFREALAPYGIPLTEIPYAFNIFMNAPVEADGRIAIREPLSKPGDSIDLRAEMDLIVAISNCPQERNPCNAFKPTRLQVILWEPV